MLLNINAATMHSMQPNLPRWGCRVGQFFCRIAFASQCFGKMGDSLFLPIKQQRCYCHCSSRRPTKTPTLICTDKVESWDSKRIQLTKSFSPTPRRFERSFWRSCWKRRQSCKTLAEWLTNTLLLHCYLHAPRIRSVKIPSMAERPREAYSRQNDCWRKAMKILK